MTAIAPAPSAASQNLALAAQRTSAYATLRGIVRNDVDRLLAKPAWARQTRAWSDDYRQAIRQLWRVEELLIDAIAAERAARNQLTEAQEGTLS